MTALASLQTARFAVTSPHAEVLADIYEENINLAIWQRPLSDNLKNAVQSLFDNNIRINITEEIRVSHLLDELSNIPALLPVHPRLFADIAENIDMYACLFDVSHVGLRMRTLTTAMCPRFHEDKVQCRLITTYAGKGTEWLPHDSIDRSKLGAGNNGKPDHESGLYQNVTAIQSMQSGDVALLKGSLWSGNEHGAIVHRSPQPEVGEQRLILTLDCL